MSLTYRSEGDKKTEQKGLMWSQAKGCQQPPEAGKGEELMPPQDLQGSYLGQHLGFGLLAFRTVGQYISVLLENHQVCRNLLQGSQDTSTVILRKLKIKTL